MNLALIAVTTDGIKVAERIKNLDNTTTLFLPQKIKQANLDATYFSKKLADQMREIFSVYDGLIFVMASGIVVRVIRST